MLKLLALSAITLTPLVATAAPMLEEETVIIHHTQKEPSTIEILVEDILVDCGSTHYHSDGCALGYRGITW